MRLGESNSLKFVRSFVRSLGPNFKLTVNQFEFDSQGMTNRNKFAKGQEKSIFIRE